MPNFETSSALVETATKCLATASADPSFSISQARAETALVSVSSVVKVFEATMNSVYGAFTSRRTSARCVASMLETK